MKRIIFYLGITLMVLNLTVWTNVLFLARDRAMDIFAAIPVLVAGAFLLLKWYKNSNKVVVTKSQRWKFILNTLLVNYAVLYFIYLVSDLIYAPAIDLLSMPGIILPLLLGLFITGLYLSREHEFYAGILFILWYFLVFFSQVRYNEIRNRGPYIIFGIAILIQGILYLFYSLRIKKKNNKGDNFSIIQT
jgi:hypothetical protein